jgi:hypothetical protein
VGEPGLDLVGLDLDLIGLSGASAVGVAHRVGVNTLSEGSCDEEWECESRCKEIARPCFGDEGLGRPEALNRGDAGGRGDDWCCMGGVDGRAC